ncbi:DNA repair and recombination protein RAD5C [Rostrohypoxylon terebratum]|nr:DNA repair and recombination protein RAD5C [Rostrohypoxylon terebratum]
MEVDQALEDEENRHQTTVANISSLVLDIDSVLDSLPTHGYLLQREVDKKILTNLLSHQRTGVDFFARRENREIYPECSLWKVDRSEKGDVYYQHIITGAKNPSAADCLGGILADDMGLGKTLTTLSSIVSSMALASQFAMENGEGFAKSTIVVVPSELLLNTWMQEISKHIYPGAVRFIIYHGSSRREFDPTLSDYDIILTTYGTVMAEFRRRPCPLYLVKWYRLILDEAHTIRNSSSKLFECINSIQSHIKWCITGTPIQNSLDDLGSLVRFLKVPIMDNIATFRKHISRTGLHNSLTTEEFENLRLLLGSICIRRNKSILPSQGFKDEYCRLSFTPLEREQYNLLELSLKQEITCATKGSNGSSVHHKVMEALLRLRLFCNNGLEGSEIISGVGSTSQSDEVFSILQQSDMAACAFCSCDVLSANRLVDSKDGYLTQCRRLICRECMVQHRIESPESDSNNCSFCKTLHVTEESSQDDRLSSKPRIRQYPSKIEAVTQDIKTHYLQDKCVIFSFWKKTLNIVGNALDDKHIKYLRIDGDVAPGKRHTILNEFQCRNGWRVLLMTFSTGAIGLNDLTVANRIYILEPQWNPAVENQAIGRLVRLDQTRKVTVIRYLMHKSVEEVVQSKQKRKIRLAKGGFATEGDGYWEKVNQVSEFIVGQ